MDIDTTGFELGSPTYVETLRHQTHMLCVEIEQLRADLERAKSSITKLVEINSELNERIISECRRANCAYIDYVNLVNYARWSYGVDLCRDDAEREKTGRLNEQFKDRIRPPVDEPMRKPSLSRPHGLMPGG